MFYDAETPSPYDFRPPTLAEVYAHDAQALGYCCATAFAGGDCAHSMADVPPYEVDPIDGRPLRVEPWA